MTATSAPIGRRPGLGPLGRIGRAIAARSTGFSAVGVKELRGRMRGKRAFVLLTIYLVILGGFAWMVELLLEQAFSNNFGAQTYATAQIGRGVFIALLLLETLLVMFLAPAYTTGAISLEREKQTIDMLITTPISSLAIVLGKLFSALTYVFLLIVSSIPLTALVFVFGGVAPEDVVKGYVMLLATAFGLGSIGLFFSALFRRTQAATVVTYFAVLALTLGAFFVWTFWGVMAGGAFGRTEFDQNGNPIQSDRGRPPEALLWFNPFVSAVDVICGTETGFGGTCSIIDVVNGTTTNEPGFREGVAVPAPMPVDGGVPPKFAGGGGFAAVPEPIVQPVQARDTFWPRAAVAWLVLSVILILLSVNLVSPTRRWHRPRLLGGAGNRATPVFVSWAAPEPPPASGPPVAPDGDDP
ncbi:MAG: ABC transporter permease [Chloroflexota bacterium]|nr:ABC transporter permease [Chloroflexota bacterium]